MNVLLLSMPIPSSTCPQSSSGSQRRSVVPGRHIDPHHGFRIADLILVSPGVIPTYRAFDERVPPDVVGLSVRTFQRETAFKIAAPRSASSTGGHVGPLEADDPSLARVL